MSTWLADVGVVVPQADVSCQPGELPSATVLEDIVGEFGEDDGQEEDLKDDDDGHVVDAGLDGAEGVVVERNK